MEGGRSGAFLRLTEGEARGVWSRGREWVAHAGSVAVASAGPGAGEGRFRAIRDATRRLTREAGVRPGARWYGGFAFQSDHGATGAWRDFPSALFVLPRLELVGREDGSGHLRLRAPLEPEEDPEGRRLALEEELSVLRDRLLDAGPERDPDPPVGLELRETDPGRWSAVVQRALEAIGEGRFSKAVLARTQAVEAERPLDPVAVVEALRAENPSAHVFLFEPRPGRVFVGAAPETVATLEEGAFHATAVAGSTPRGRDAAEDRRRARELLASPKDRAEQRLVVEDVVERLALRARSIVAEPEPHVLTLPRIQHLETRIRARVDPGVHVLDLLEDLHPTPAVCGYPRDPARAFLREEELFERGWYAGPVGWFDGEGNGVFAPALRSTVGGDGRWSLFAGAGIVDGSEAEAEWAETAMKFEPARRALEAAAGSPVERHGTPGADPDRGGGASREATR